MTDNRINSLNNEINSCEFEIQRMSGLIMHETDDNMIQCYIQIINDYKAKISELQEIIYLETDEWRTTIYDN